MVSLSVFNRNKHIEFNFKFFHENNCMSCLLDGKGVGKIKKRGRKKKRKDRRKLHNDTCSKEMSRGSDIVAVFVHPGAIQKQQNGSQDNLKITDLKSSVNPEQYSNINKEPVSTVEPGDSLSHETFLSGDRSSKDSFVVINEAVLDGVLTPGTVHNSPECVMMYKDSEIEINFIPTEKNQPRIGAGSRCAQISFNDSVTGTQAVFPPVFVPEVDLEHLVNLVAEQAEKFKVKTHKLQLSRGKILSSLLKVLRVIICILNFN